jgi:hypothetical protein
MKAIKTSLIQQITNKANSKEEFTTNLNNSKSRYVVSQFNIYTGTNPSICFDLILRVEKIVTSGFFCSIGGWINDKNTYFLDANLHFDNLNYAIESGKKTGQIAIYDQLENKVINLKY